MAEDDRPGDRMALDLAQEGGTYVVDRVPEDDIDLLQFLVESQIIPDREVTVAQAAPHLGVFKIATATEEVSVGYNVAKKILVRSPVAHAAAVAG